MLRKSPYIIDEQPDRDVIYRDKLVLITVKEIIFHHYYFPTGKDKLVLFSDIECILVKEPSVRNGKWRYHGTGTFKTWFPLDKHRPKRDRIFIADLKSQWVNIGFTVENGERVETIFRERYLVKDG